MKINKILVPIDGSMYSRQAAEVAWSIAKQTGANVTALHVVDSPSVVELLGHVEPGFLTVADYKAERDAVIDSMTRASKRLVDEYRRLAEANGVGANAMVETGNPCDIIKSAARDYDLVVIGHKPFNAVEEPERYRRQLMRLSAAEYLAEVSPKPLLVVQGKASEWSSMTIMLSLEHVNRCYIDSAVGISKELGLQPALVCLSTTEIEEPPVQFIRDLRSSDASLADVPVAVVGMEELRDREYEVWDNPTGTTAWDEWNSTLLTIPTRPVPGRRLTVADGAPSRFIRYSTLPAVLLYPEEVDGEPSSELNRKELLGRSR